MSFYHLVTPPNIFFTSITTPSACANNRFRRLNEILANIDTRRRSDRAQHNKRADGKNWSHRDLEANFLLLYFFQKYAYCQFQQLVTLISSYEIKNILRLYRLQHVVLIFMFSNQNVRIIIIITKHFPFFIKAANFISKLPLIFKSIKKNLIKVRELIYNSKRISLSLFHFLLFFNLVPFVDLMKHLSI